MSVDEGNDKRPSDEAETPRSSVKREKPPVTIDLSAEPAKGEGASGPSEEDPADLESRAKPEDRPGPVAAGGPPNAEHGSGRGILALIFAGVVGGIIATVLGIAYHASGVVPSRSETLAQQALTKIDDLAGSVAAIDKRVTAVESRPADPDVSALTDRLTTLETLEAENQTRIEKLEAAPAPPADGSDDGSASVTASLRDIDTRLGNLEAESAKAAAVGTAVAALDERVTGLAATVKDNVTRLDALAARPDPAGESERAARAVAIGMLQQAADKGGPFATDLAMLKALGVDQAELGELEPLAAKDTPSLTTLQERFPAVADAVLVATSDVDPDAGFFEQLGALGRGLVSVRPTTAIEGNTPGAIVSRMQAAVDSGDLGKALDERKSLPDPGQTASVPWAAAAGDRIAIDLLVDKLVLSMTASGN